jgi:hypothetical protein
MLDLVEKHANISPSGYYRYSLRRTWDREGPSMAFVMLNPSTADAFVDDPTIRRCMGFARREKMGGITVVNLFAGRATKPEDLFKMWDSVGPQNETTWHIWLYAARPKIVCAWGAEPKAMEQAKKFRAWADGHNLALWCLGKTKDGHPRHPLYLKNDAPLEPFA